MYVKTSHMIQNYTVVNHTCLFLCFIFFKSGHFPRIPLFQIDTKRDTKMIKIAIAGGVVIHKCHVCFTREFSMHYT